MNDEQRNDALRKMARNMVHGPNHSQSQSRQSRVDEPDAGPVEHHAPPKSTEIPSVYAIGSMRGPKSVQLQAAYRKLALELTEWHH